MTALAWSSRKVSAFALRSFRHPRASRARQGKGRITILILLLAGDAPSSRQRDGGDGVDRSSA